MLRFNNLVIALFIIVYIPIFISLLRKKSALEKHILVMGFYVYIAMVIKVVFFPIPVYLSTINSFKSIYGEFSWNIIPLKSIVEIIKMSKDGILRQLCGNLILFMPFGYIVPLITSRINSMKRIILFAYMFSLSIEITQLIASLSYGYNYKFFDIDDMILNTIGAIIGYLMLKLTKPFLVKALYMESSSALK